MPELSLLEELVVVLSACLVMVYALRKIHVPAIVSYLAAGLLVGPGALNLIHDLDTINIIAHIGLVFLLFTIGLRFSLQELWQLRWLVLVAGPLQVLLTIVAAAGLIKLAPILLAAAGLAPSQVRVTTPAAIFLGFLLAQSSTAVVLRILEERGEGPTPQGRFMLSLLIFQDLAVIPLMLLVPVLGQAERIPYTAAAWTLLKSALAVTLIIVAARFLIPWIMERVVHTRNREMFTFTAVLIALGTAYFAERIGLSLALGALVAGIVISESQYSHQVLAEVAPLRDALSSLFFVSIGMLLDPRLWFEQPLLSLGLLAATIALKALIVIPVALLFGQGLRVAILAGLGLAQVGELAFVLAQAGQPFDLLAGPMYQQFLSISVLTMALTPLSMVASPALSQTIQQTLRFLRSRPWRAMPASPAPPAAASPRPAEPSAEQLTRHVIIVGYGVNGRNIARVLRQMRVRFVVVELNPNTVRDISRQGEPVVYGDATQQEILLKAGIHDARVLIVAIPDPRAARQIVAIARGMSRTLTIIVRTRFVAEVDLLHQLGADDVVPEEFETSIALVGRVMAIYGASEKMIEQQEEMLRSEHYQALRTEEAKALRSPALREMLAHADFAEVALPADSPAVNQSLKTLDLRGRTGASIMGISRGRKIIGNPAPDVILQAGDVVGVLGGSDEVAAAKEYLLHGTTSPESRVTAPPEQATTPPP